MIQILCDGCAAPMAASHPTFQYGNLVLAVEILPGGGKTVDYCPACVTRKLLAAFVEGDTR